MWTKIYIVQKQEDNGSRLYEERERERERKRERERERKRGRERS